MLIETLIIIIVITILILLFYQICNDLTLQHRLSYGLKGGDIHQAYHQKTLVKTLTNIVFKRLKHSDYVWSYKHDGINRIVKVHGKELLDTDTNKVFMLDVKYPDKESVFETECIKISTGFKYIILDVLSYNGENVTNNTYVERMNIKIPKSNHLQKIELHEIENVDEMLKHGLSTRSHCDGIVLHSKYTSYLKTDAYKIKPRCMNTVDCLLKLDNSTNVYKLYVCSSKQNIDVNKISTMKYKNCVYKLLKTPFMQCFDYDPKMVYKNVKGFDMPMQFKSSINKLSKQNLNYKIVEMAYNGQQFWPVRIRYDKQFANSYNGAINTIIALFDPIASNPFHVSFEHNLSPESIPEGTSALILGNCSSKMLQMLYEKGYNNVFIVNSDTCVLSLCYERVQTMLKAISMPHRFYLNLICDINDAKLRSEYPDDGFDLCILNNKSVSSEKMEMLKMMIKPTGKILNEN